MSKASISNHPGEKMFSETIMENTPIRFIGEFMGEEFNFYFNLENNLFACKEPNVSPFQKPTFITISIDDLDKKFAL